MFATEIKEWLQPEAPDPDEISRLAASHALQKRLQLHGMARLAFDDARVYLNGTAREASARDIECVRELCARRRMNIKIARRIDPELLAWLLAGGAFEAF